jgi:hypothetical protein
VELSLTSIHRSAWRDCPKRVGGACGVALQSTSTALFDPFWPPYASQIHTHSVARIPFRTVSEGEFSEVDLPTYGVLRSSALLGTVLWFCVIGYIHSPTRAYHAFVAWPRDRRVKAQDSDLPTFQMRASYPTNYLPLGRSASPQLLRWC